MVRCDAVPGRRHVVDTYRGFVETIERSAEASPLDPSPSGGPATDSVVMRGLVASSAGRPPELQGFMGICRQFTVQYPYIITSIGDQTTAVLCALHTRYQNLVRSALYTAYEWYDRTAAVWLLCRGRYSRTVSRYFLTTPVINIT